MNYIQQLGQNAARAKKQIAGCPTGEKNRILTEIAAILRANASEILKANEQDIAQAKDNGISDTMIDRLRLTMERIDGIADACLKLTDLEDPVGEVIEGSTRPNGMKITKIRVPMGVIGIIFESRPNVTVDAAALCIKSGNAAILRGGKEAFHSNCKLMELMREAVAKCGYDKDMIQLVEDTSREVSTQMMRANDSIDVLIPRGGAGLIQAVVQNATVPVIETGTGNCHIYVDETADLAMAVQITDNGKTQRPSVCNALETCLVHEAVAEQFLPMLQQKLEEHQVEIRGCERTRQILGDSVIPATEEDYATEFLDYIISIRVVSSVDEAIQHISKYSTGHSECIITESYRNAEKFQKEVDSACVYVNCSTRFTDGGEFGLGAEIGISTQKLHARGPMGLREMTFFKKMSNKYRKEKHVFYEICNEPNGGVQWKTIKSYAKSVIKVIRKADKNAVVIVGTPTWSQDVDMAAKSPLKGKNIMYAFHFYAATHGDDLRAKVNAALRSKLPLFCSEFSACDASGNGNYDFSSANKWISLMNRNKISYCCWSLSNKPESASLLKSSCKKTSGFKTSDLSKMGRYIVKKYRKK